MRPQGDNRHLRNRAFTLVEVLAALFFLAILVPAIVEGLTISNRAAVLSDRRSLAAELAENKLNEILIDNTWQSASDTSGDFSPDHPLYKWEMKQADWQGDATNPMTELSVEVSFPVQGATHSFRLTTLVSTSAASASATPSPTLQ